MGYRDKPRSYDNKSYGSSQSFSAVCDECKSKCELPFKPSSDKPVYCSDCFRKKQREGSRDSGRSNSRGDGRSNFRNDNRSNFKDRKMHPAVCNSCGNKCEVPFQPTSGKPVYCDNCFGKDGNSKRGGSDNRNSGRDQVGEQIASLNIKLDKIMKALNIVDEPKVVEKDKSSKKEKKSKKAGKKTSRSFDEVQNKRAQDKPFKKILAKKVAPKKVAAKKTAKKKKVAAKKAPAKKTAAVKKAAKKKAAKKK